MEVIVDEAENVRASIDGAVEALREAVLLVFLVLLLGLGNMPYSAVTQPSPLPRLCGGTFSSTEAVHNTWVLPKAINTEPSACMVKLRVMRTGRNASLAR
jgi:hypothetical protein